MKNKVKEKFAAGRTALGVWADVFDPNLIEMFGLLGYDYAVIDGEHTALDHRQASELIRACDVSGMVAIVRVPEINKAIIERYLDLGAMGIYVPHVKSADDARRVVDATKYLPRGHRGAASLRGLRFGVVGSMDDRVREANEATMVIALVEDVEGIEHLDEIIAVDGVDVVGIGSGDLSFSMGHIANKQHPEVQRVTLESEARVAASGKVFDSVVNSVEEALECQRRGSLMISVSVRHYLAVEGPKFRAAVS